MPPITGGQSTVLLPAGSRLGILRKVATAPRRPYSNFVREMVFPKYCLTHDWGGGDSVCGCGDFFKMTPCSIFAASLFLRLRSLLSIYAASFSFVSFLKVSTGATM